MFHDLQASFHFGLFFPNRHETFHVELCKVQHIHITLPMMLVNITMRIVVFGRDDDGDVAATTIISMGAVLAIKIICNKIMMHCD